MKNRIYREYGSLLTAIGLTLFLTYVAIFSYWLGDPIALSGLMHSINPVTLVIRSFLPIGLVLTYSGMIIRRKDSEGNLFLTKVDEPIHSAKPWYQGPESGLYMTCCEILPETRNLNLGK